MDLCRTRCCALYCSHEPSGDEVSPPVRLVERHSFEATPPLLRISSIHPIRKSSTGHSLQPPQNKSASNEPTPNDPPDVEMKCSPLLYFNRPVNLPSALTPASDATTRNFESIIALREREPCVAVEDKRLTLGGDERYMTEPSRMRYNEDIANRNMLSTSSNVYPEPNPPAQKSVPLSVGPSRYGEDVADRVNAQDFSPAESAPSLDSSRRSPKEDKDYANLPTSQNRPQEYYSSRFKPTLDAYTPEQRGKTAERRLLGLRALEETMPCHWPATRDRSSVGSISPQRHSGSSSKTSLSKAGSKPRRPSLERRSLPQSVNESVSATTSTSAARSLTVEEIEAKEVQRMARDNFYESRAVHPSGKGRSAPLLPVDSGSNTSSTVTTERHKSEGHIAHTQPFALPSLESSLEPGYTPSRSIDTRTQMAGTSSSTGTSIRHSIGQLDTVDEVTDQIGTPPARTPTPESPYPEIIPPAEVFSEQNTTTKTHGQCQERSKLLPLTRPLPAADRAASQTTQRKPDSSTSAPKSSAPHRAPTMAPTDLKKEKTWPVKFDTKSGGYEGLEEVVAEKRRKMVVGGLLARTETVDRSMPGGWVDGSTGVRGWGRWESESVLWERYPLPYRKCSVLQREGLS